VYSLPKLDVPFSVSRLDDHLQTITFFVSVVLVNLLLQYVITFLRAGFTVYVSHTFRYRDGKSNYMEGLMLVTLYLVIALACASCLGVLFFLKEANMSLIATVWVS
jgi:hypothetical protein